MVNEPAEAIEKPQEQINKLSEQQIIDKILENMPSTEEIEVKVPSLNKFYTLQDPGKSLSLRPMTFEDEKVMMSKSGGVDPLNVLLTRCLSNINVDSLLQMDKLYLIMKLREISYGDDYTAGITCNECGKENRVSFTLSKLPVRYVEETLTDPQIIQLPVLNKKVKVRFPRVGDENYFSSAQQAMGNLWRFVESIDNCESKTVISKVIPQLPLKDAHFLFDVLGGSKYGTETKVRFICNYCSNNEVMELPITADFFTSN